MQWNYSEGPNCEERLADFYETIRLHFHGIRRWLLQHQHIRRERELHRNALQIANALSLFEILIPNIPKCERRAVLFVDDRKDAAEM